MQPQERNEHTYSLGTGKAIAVLTSGGDAQGKRPCPQAGFAFGVCLLGEESVCGCLGFLGASIFSGGWKWNSHGPETLTH